MKPRKWVVILGLTLFILGISQYFVGRVLEENRNIKNVLTTHISQVAGGKFDVGRIRIGFFSVYMSDVKLSLPFHTATISVNDIKIGLSFFKFVFTHGDISQSIDKVIFVEPKILLSFKETFGLNDSTRKDTSISFDNFPVDEILVKDGNVVILDENNNHVISSERLDGRLLEKNNNLLFELSGKLGSLKRNMFLSGIFSQSGNSNHLSVRLKDAKIKKSFELGKFKFVRGVIDGVCEFSFNDAFSADKLDLNGTIKVSNATFYLPFLDDKISNAQLQLILNDSRIQIKSLSCKWHDSKMRGVGQFGLLTSDSTNILLNIQNIDPSLFSSNVPKHISENIVGDLWVDAKVFRKSGNLLTNVNFKAGGLSTFGVPVTEFRGIFGIENKQIQIDSLLFKSNSYTTKAFGIINYEKSPIVYSLNTMVSGVTDSMFPNIDCSFDVAGVVRGIGNNFNYNFDIKCDSITAFNTTFDSTNIRIKGDNNSLSVGSDKVSNFNIFGNVDSLLNANAKVNLNFWIGKNPVRSIFSSLQIPFLDTLDSAEISVNITGSPDSLVINGFTNLKNEYLHGTVSINAIYADSFLKWNVSDKNFFVSKSRFPISASGMLSKDSISVNELKFLDGAVGHGTVTFGKSNIVNFSLNLNDVSLSSCDDWFLNGNDVLRAGEIGGSVRASGLTDNPTINANLHVRNADLFGINPVATDLVFFKKDRNFIVLPFVIRKDKKIIITIDTTCNTDGVFKTFGSFTDISLANLLKSVVPDGFNINGNITGQFKSSNYGFPIVIKATSPHIGISNWSVDSALIDLEAFSNGVKVKSIKASDSTLLYLNANGYIPWSFINNGDTKKDTLLATVRLNGNLLAFIAKHLDSPIDGSALGNVDVAFSVINDKWHYSSASIDIPDGVLTLRPFVLDDIKDLKFSMEMDDSANLQTYLEGKIRRRRIIVKSNHSIPNGYKPIMLGPINAGVLQITTPDGPVEHHLPGFQRVGETVKVLYEKRDPFSAFTITGPIDKIGIVGAWVVSNTEWTYPFLETDEIPWDFDIFPYVTWNMEVKPGRRFVYFYDIGAKRKFIRFAELTIDPNKTVVIKGRDLDGTFELNGGLRSFRGAIYYGKVFDKNLDAGIDFAPQPFDSSKGIDNMPIIWGSAEALADTSRFERIKLTLQVKDPKTGALRERGRFTEVVFRLSSDYEEIPGESEVDFYKKAGLKFTSLGGAGKVVVGLGYQYLQRHFFQRIEKKLARHLGLDIITFESSIASNYFNYLYDNQFRDLKLSNKWDNIALANLGVTFGRYFLKDKVFLKWRTEFVSVDTLLRPEHSIGFEYRPMQYFMLDVSYGFHRGVDAIEYNPRINFQLRLPITKMRKSFNF